jgi:hypothetical protein
MFILVVLYNAEYPSDDQSCPVFNTERDCLVRKTFRGRQYCTWEQGACNFSDEQFSIYTIVFLAWFELLILAPLGFIIMIIFQYFILAPTHSNVQNQFKVTLTYLYNPDLLTNPSLHKVRHISAIGRRLSSVGNGISSSLTNGTRRLSILGNQVTTGIRRLSMTIKASDGVVKKKASSVRRTILLDDRFVEKRRNMVSILSYHHHYRHRQHIVDHDDANDNDIAQALYQKAIDSIKAYRRHLNDDELVEFDKHWDCYFPDTSSTGGSGAGAGSGTATAIGTGTTSSEGGKGSSNSNTAGGVKVSSGSRYDQFSQPLYSKICHIQELASEDYA